MRLSIAELAEGRSDKMKFSIAELRPEARSAEGRSNK